MIEGFFGEVQKTKNERKISWNSSIISCCFNHTVYNLAVNRKKSAAIF